MKATWTGTKHGADLKWGQPDALFLAGGGVAGDAYKNMSRQAEPFLRPFYHIFLAYYVHHSPPPKNIRPSKLEEAVLAAPHPPNRSMETRCGKTAASFSWASWRWGGAWCCPSPSCSQIGNGFQASGQSLFEMSAGRRGERGFHPPPAGPGRSRQPSANAAQRSAPGSCSAAF